MLRTVFRLFLSSGDHGCVAEAGRQRLRLVWQRDHSSTVLNEKLGFLTSATKDKRKSFETLKGK